MIICCGMVIEYIFVGYLQDGDMHMYRYISSNILNVLASKAVDELTLEEYMRDYMDIQRGNPVEDDD